MNTELMAPPLGRNEVAAWESPHARLSWHPSFAFAFPLLPAHNALDFVRKIG